MTDLFKAIFCAAIGTLATGAVTLAPQNGKNVIVVFSPLTPPPVALISVLDSGLLPVSFPRDYLVVAAPSSNMQKLVLTKPQGALFLIDAMGAGGCYSTNLKNYKVS